jgi:phosphoglycerate dehydrogenase-like enzyme
MISCIAVHPNFDRSWPFSADYFNEVWKKQGDVVFIRIDADDNRPLGQIVPKPDQIDRLVCLQVPVTVDCLKAMGNLREAVFQTNLGEEERKHIKDAGIKIYHSSSVGFWGQTVAEFGLALTLCGLRRIPQIHHEIITNHRPWNYAYKMGPNGPLRGAQFGDDPNFTNGTVKGKKVRVVGAGNIGSRYASFMSMLGADVAIWDPFASDPCFHRAGARKEWHLDELRTYGATEGGYAWYRYRRAYPRSSQRLSCRSGDARANLRYGGCATASSLRRNRACRRCIRHGAASA